MKNDRVIATAARMLAPGLRVGIVLLVVAFAAWSGLGDAGDRVLREPYYRLRGDRASQQHVILVAIVVVGITAQPYAGLVPTPIGALAPAQVQAHALAACADAATWAIAPSCAGS